MKLSSASILALLFIGSGAPAQQAGPQTTITYRPSPGTAPGWNSLEGDTASVLFIDASVQGRSVSAVVDTGVTFSTLDTDWVRRAGLQVNTNSVVNVDASGGAARAFPGPVVDVDVPPYSVIFTE